MEQQLPAQSFNISGKEKADYIDIIRQIKRANGSKSLLVKLPYWLFYALLALYSVFDRNPPFTTSQLKALVIDEVFEDIDWERNTLQVRRQLLRYKGGGYEFSKPEGAFYIFCKSPIEDDIKFVKHLQKYNVLVVPGTGFGGPGYFRISYCISEDVIKKALPKFKQALEEL